MLQGRFESDRGIEGLRGGELYICGRGAEKRLGRKADTLLLRLPGELVDLGLAAVVPVK